MTLSANASQIVTFNVNETVEGDYNVTVGDLVGAFTVSSKPTPLPAALTVTNVLVNPIEAWAGQSVNITFNVRNTGSENISYSLPFSVNGAVAQSVQVELAGGASETVTAALNESSIGIYNAVVGGKTSI